jgi:GTP-binding protein EngB required for normal cell division
MNIADYAHAKFELAELLRAAAVIARAQKPDLLYPFEELFARLAEDRFNIAVVGQFSRGKTSLMNAVLNTERLPMGVVPLTSVITTVQYGTEERAVIEYAERRLPNSIALDALPDFVTQQSNPGNEKGIRFARVEMPAEILRQGFYLIDTPGLGSSIAENTRTTEEFLPQADAFVIVTSYDSPLSEDELRLLNALHANACRCFIVLNKMDLTDSAERAMVEDHVRAQLSAYQDTSKLELYPVSAREAMAANREHNMEKLAASGVPALVERLIRFLLEEKNSVFLRRMADRIDAELSVFGCTKERHRLAALTAQLDISGPVSVHGLLTQQTQPRFARCAVCAPIERDLQRFLQGFQYRVMIDEGARQALHADGGLCPFHTWMYATLASSHGTCVAFPGVFDPIVAGVRALRQSEASVPQAILADLTANLNCVLCRVRREAEDHAITETAARILRMVSKQAQNLPDVCLVHLESIVGALGDEAGGILLDKTTDSWQRTADDMRRYALKRDGSRRAFTTADELDADVRGLRALAGHAALSFVRGVRR